MLDGFAQRDSVGPGRLAMTVQRDDRGVELSAGQQLSLRTDAGGLQDYAPESNAANPRGEDRTGFFPISPGTKTVVVRLPRDGYDMNYFYVHVDGQPLTRNVDFSGRPAPAGPSFSVKEVCYWGTGTAEGCTSSSDGKANWTCCPRQGAGAGALSERPASYVPFLTPKYNEDRTLATRKTAGSAQVPVEYDWLYRPEMQFSVFGLEMQQVNLKNSDGTTRNILTPGTISSLYSADNMLRTLYRLEGTTTPSLTAVDGAQRQLVFALGSQFVDATISNPCEPGQTCSASSYALATDAAKKGMKATDFLALRLLQKATKPTCCGSTASTTFGFTSPIRTTKP